MRGESVRVDPPSIAPGTVRRRSERGTNNLPSVRLIHGDCLEEMKAIDPGTIDLVLADLPYGTTACAWDTIIPFEPLWESYRRVLKPSGAVVLTACQPFTSKLVMSNPKWFRHELVWDKVTSTGFLDAKRRPLRRHESVLVFGPKRPTYNPQMVEGKPYVSRRKPHVIETIGPKKATMVPTVSVNTGTRFPTSIITFSNANGRGKLHPTQKPVELFEWIIRTYSNPGDTVLDNCAGSGTTPVACVNTGRSCLAIERDPKYFAIATERLEELGRR